MTFKLGAEAALNPAHCGGADQLKAQIAPIQTELRQLLEQASPKKARNRWHRRFANNLLKVWLALWTFVTAQGVEPTNFRCSAVPRRRAALEAARRGPADYLAAGRLDQPDPRFDQATRIRTEEPEAHQPDAHADARQQPGRPQRLGPGYPRLSRNQRGPSQHHASRGRRCRWPSVAALTALQREASHSGVHSQIRFHRKMR
jgi:hypothetical protein